MVHREIWEIEVTHPGLNKYRHIRGTDKYVVEQKAYAQKAIWDEIWQKKQNTERKREEKERQIQDKEQKKLIAEQRTQEAQLVLEKLQKILLFGLTVNDKVAWEELKDKSQFNEPEPIKPLLIELPQEPKKSDKEFTQKITLIDKLIPSRKMRKICDSLDRFEDSHKKWHTKLLEVNKNNENIKLKYFLDLENWEKLQKEFYQKQNEYNLLIEQKKNLYYQKDPDSIYEYCDLVLNNSNYPDFFSKEFDIEYNNQNNVLIVDYSLPSPDAIPTIKEVKYIQAKDEFRVFHIPENILNKLYDDVIYQVALRTIHELFQADLINALKSIVFNGWVKSIDKATGNSVNACIITVQVSKEEFTAINLAHVDPKACFKSLKGIGSSKLHSLTPVAPLLQINKDDRRFITSHSVTNEINESCNLAAMDWNEFEHLIRELFEKEFSEKGGEVKVTQASRDGGVDAVAFDPDPIRGGKIVIQAKRYTNIVGVAAVRDLFGTLINEGAMKGILITTSDYGPDAYEFARGKPLTLLNGSNLLYLLEKHGTKAKIDLKEAKKILSENI